jgi:hypothetical protein
MSTRRVSGQLGTGGDFIGAVSRDDGKPMPISPSIGVENVDHHAAEFVLDHDATGAPIHDPAFTAARAGMSSLGEIADKLLAAEGASKARDVDSSTMLRLQRGIAAMLKSSADGVAVTMKTLSDHRAAVVDEIESALGTATSATSVTDNHRGGEVRAMLRALPEKDRAAALQDAVRENDVPFVAACLVSPRLAGLTAQQAATLRADAERTFAPAATKRRDGLDALSRRLRIAGDEIANRWGPLVGKGDSAAARAERALAGLTGGAA